MCMYQQIHTHLTSFKVIPVDNQIYVILTSVCICFIYKENASQWAYIQLGLEQKYS